jgi:site-specific DNA-methyltransferase (adenine-specific)
MYMANKKDHELIYCFAKKTPEYDVSSHSEYTEQKEYSHTSQQNGKGRENKCKAKTHKDPLPTSVLPSSWCKFNLDNRTGHRTAKPVKLMEFLLKYWSKPGDTVLDPTAGSGSMGVACKQMDRKFIGIEKDPLIYELMKERIAKAEPPKQDTSD